MENIAYYRNSLGMALVLIPAGEFMMGSGQSAAEVARVSRVGRAGWYADEHPQHRVRITRPFYMGAYEVTQAQYEALMGSNLARSIEPQVSNGTSTMS